MCYPDEILHADDDFDSAARITVIANDADSGESRIVT